jgi:LuxR family capsular biosynthesis transcriptional activator
MGHVNDYHGFVQLHPAGINRVPDWQGVRKRDITEVHSAPSLKALCETSRPAVVFINEDCFIHHEDSNQLIRQIISQYPATLFVIFMSLANIHFDHYLLVRKNLLICSKSLTEKDLDDILAIRLKYENYRATRINIPTLSLSQTESNMLQMWMAGHGTSHISAQMNIKAKTVSSHKGNIKRKFIPTINR